MRDETKTIKSRALATHKRTIINRGNDPKERERETEGERERVEKRTACKKASKQWEI